MFVQLGRYAIPLTAVVLAAAVLLAGCGSDSGSRAEPEAGSPTDSEEVAPDVPGESDPTDPDRPPPDIEDADPEAFAVIEEWAATLARGDEEGAAELFALPSIVENGPVVTRIEAREDAVAFNRTLSCGAIPLSAQTTGRITSVTFELIERPGGECGGGVGAEAATSFVIEDGRIAEWRRVPTERERRGRSSGQTV